MSRAAEIAAKARRLNAAAEPPPIRDSSLEKISTSGPGEVSSSSSEDVRSSATEDASTSANTESRSRGGEEVSTSSVPPIRRSEPGEGRRRAVKAGNIRLSVDISPAEHRQLMRIAARMADELGVTRVAHQEIMRALLRLMLAEPEVLDQVRGEVEDWRRLAP